VVALREHQEREEALAGTGNGHKARRNYAMGVTSLDISARTVLTPRSSSLRWTSREAMGLGAQVQRNNSRPHKLGQSMRVHRHVDLEVRQVRRDLGLR